MMGNGRTLVSGSRDKNLRLYDLSQEGFPEADSCLQAHNDHINVLEADESQQLLYSGSRDGIVKVWSLNQNQATPELQMHATLEGNA